MEPCLQLSPFLHLFQNQYYNGFSSPRHFNWAYHMVLLSFWVILVNWSLLPATLPFLILCPKSIYCYAFVTNEFLEGWDTNVLKTYEYKCYFYKAAPWSALWQVYSACPTPFLKIPEGWRLCVHINLHRHDQFRCYYKCSSLNGCGYLMLEFGGISAAYRNHTAVHMEFSDNRHASLQLRPERLLWRLP